MIGLVSKVRSVAIAIPVCIVFASIASIGTAAPRESRAAATSADMGPADMAAIKRYSEGEKQALSHLIGDPRFTPAPSSVPVSRGRTLVAGELWSLTTYENSAGEFCWGISLPGEGQGMSCRDRSELFASSPVWATWGARQSVQSAATEWDSVWVEGFVIQSVASVEVVNTDCSRARIAIDDAGVFLQIITRATLAANKWPYEVLAYDTQRRLLGRRQLHITAPQTHATEVAHVAAPEPRTNCVR